MDAASWADIAPTIAGWFPQRELAAAGLVLLALLPLGALWAGVDSRRVGGEPVALKPMRFALSIGAYLLTVSWMLRYAQPARLSAPFVRGAVWAMLAGAGLELACIVLQAARGRRSHMNVAAPFDAAISALMLVTAILFTSMVVPLGWEIAHRPRPDAPPLMVSAVVGGLVATFVLGALTGAAMGRVAAEAAAPKVALLPLRGRVRGGAPRIAHFLGVHAMQAFPIFATAAVLCGRAAAVLLLVAALGYAAATLMLLSRTGARPR